VSDRQRSTLNTLLSVRKRALETAQQAVHQAEALVHQRQSETLEAREQLEHIERNLTSIDREERTALQQGKLRVHDLQQAAVWSHQADHRRAEARWAVKLAEQRLKEAQTASHEARQALLKAQREHGVVESKLEQNEREARKKAEENLDIASEEAYAAKRRS
jgi:hypothetical protein